MIEGRAIIKDIEKAKKSIESLGGIFKSNYILKDIIFIPKIGKYKLNNDFIRVRINIKSDWIAKKVILIRKQNEFKNIGKIDKILFRKEFDTEEEAFIFIQKKFPEFKKGFEYEREGWEYQLNKNRIFIEDIKGWKPSIEIETEKEEDLEDLFNKIGVLELIKESIPEIMNKLLKHQN